jgi:hypothetical protein
MMAMAAALAKLIFARVMMASKFGGGQQLGNRTIGSRCSAMFPEVPSDGIFDAVGGSLILKDHELRGVGAPITCSDLGASLDGGAIDGGRSTEPQRFRFADNRSLISRED